MSLKTLPTPDYLKATRYHDNSFDALVDESLESLKRPQPILTVIIPVYNAERTLRRCLDSLADQVNDKVQVVVIDDGSTDNSIEIMSEYHMSISDYRFNETNGGVSFTRSRGIRIAEGKYITFLDADDELAPDAIEKMCNMALVAEQKKLPIVQFNHARKYEGIAAMSHKYDNKPGFYSLNNLPVRWFYVWNKIYSQEFLMHNGIYFTNKIDFGEDELFNLECLRYCEGITCVEAVTVIKHFDNPDSLCHRVNKDKLLDLCLCLMNHLREKRSAQFKAAVRGVLAEHWNSKLYKSFFGGERS